MTKSEKILRAIKEAGGMRHCEIIRFIVEECDKHKYQGRASSGVWGTNLFGASRNKQRPGLLNWYCIRKSDGKWHVTEPIVGPFLYKRTGIRSMSWLANKSRREQQAQKFHEMIKESKCSNCGELTYRSFRKKTPDRKACIKNISVEFHNDGAVHSAAVEAFDCLMRQWKRNNKYSQWKHRAKISMYNEFEEIMS